MAAKMESHVGVKDPVLSICILNWNTYELVRDCLMSIFADPQAADWEVVVVDNASADGSVEKIRREFSQAKIIVSAENLGFSGGNNLALQQVRGCYALLLNSDTLVEIGALGGLVDFMDSQAQAGVVGPMLLNTDGSLQLSCGISPSLWSEIVHKLLLHKLFPFFKLGRWDHAQTRSVGWVTGACLMVRRQVLDEVGFLDPQFFMYHEDVEWCLRFKRRGWRVYYYPFSRVVHLGGQSTRKNFSEMLVVSQRSLYYLFQKHFGRFQVYALRLLTIIEMVLRSLGWSSFFIFNRARRPECRQRLKAYQIILIRTLLDRSYWAPMELDVTKKSS
jgi:hypothetical protein